MYVYMFCIFLVSLVEFIEILFSINVDHFDCEVIHDTLIHVNYFVINILFKLVEFFHVAITSRNTCEKLHRCAIYLLRNFHQRKPHRSDELWKISTTILATHIPHPKRIMGPEPPSKLEVKSSNHISETPASQTTFIHWKTNMLSTDPVHLPPLSNRAPKEFGHKLFQLMQNTMCGDSIT